MVWGAELADHLWALLMVWVAACVPGYVLSRMLPGPLRCRDTLATWPLLGGAYWAAALYLLSFRWGLVVAAALALAAAIALAYRSRRAAHRVEIAPKPLTVFARYGRRRVTASVILLVGCAPYLTPVFAKHVPDGMDASRYALNARLIAAEAGLPDSLAPFAPGVPFGAMNHGVPALAAVAVLCGASPAAAVLAAVPLTFAALVLSLYLLVRLVTPRVPAAVTAVAVAWFAHQAQRTLSWGGFPCVLTLAVGFLSARLLVDVLRGKRGPGWIPLGLCAGAQPILHGCMAAGWLYIGVPVATVVGLIVSRHRRRGLAGAGLAALLAAGIVLAYLVVARPRFDGGTGAWIDATEMQDAYAGKGLQLLLTVPAYLGDAMGKFLTVVFIVAVGVLAVRRRWSALMVVVSVLLANGLVLMNAKYGLLPGSLLLYPVRVREFALGAAALGVGLAWRRLPPAVTVRRPRPVIVASVLFVLALSQHYRYFQRTACRPVISEEAWQALQWSARHLSPADDFVATLYGTAGAYLPAVAGVGVTAWHAHFDQTSAAHDMARTRPVTHVLDIERQAIRSGIGKGRYDRESDRLDRLVRDRAGKIVFASGPVRIYQLTPPPG